MCWFFFFNICPKMKSLKIIQVWPFSCLLLSSSSLRQKKIHIITTFLCHGPLPFSTRTPLLPLPLQAHWTITLDNVGLKIYFLETSHFDIFFFPLGVNQSGPGMSSTTNHIFCKALGWLHGPWCKQPLSVPYSLDSRNAITSTIVFEFNFNSWLGRSNIIEQRFTWLNISFSVNI